MWEQPEGGRLRQAPPLRQPEDGRLGAEGEEEEEAEAEWVGKEAFRLMRLERRV